MKNNIKAVVLDLDGTFLIEGRHISKQNMQAVRAVMDRGVMVTIATGRMFATSVGHAKKAGITEPLITYNGAMIKEHKGQMRELFHQPIAEQEAKKVIDLFAGEQAHLNFYKDDEIYVNRADESLKAYVEARMIGYHVTPDFNSITPCSPTKLLIIDNDNKRLLRLGEKIRCAADVSVFTTWSSYCDIMDKGISKFSGVQWYCNYRGIALNEVLAIGDERNDAPMIRAAGIGVAMGNALDEVKDQADYVTGTSQENGVAQALRKFILDT